MIKFRIIYPKWEKLIEQLSYDMPPHGPAVFAASIPDDVEIEFIDENVEPMEFNDSADLIGISMMLTAQVKRGWEIADTYRKMGKKVLFGGIAAMLHYKETFTHADSVFLGESEGKMEHVFKDFRSNNLQKTYDFMKQLPSLEKMGPANRDIYKNHKYITRNVKIVYPVHASRGCIYNCKPCCVGFLGGKKFRPRPVHKVAEEVASIKNNRLFFVDNTFTWNKKWLLELFGELKHCNKHWCSHPIMDDDDVLKSASEAGAWFVYQSIYTISDKIRERVKRYKAHGISVFGSIILGFDFHTEDSIKRLIDFLIDIDLDLAEFTLLTPFPRTETFSELARQQRIIDFDWNKYNCGHVVFEPRHMSTRKLYELYVYSWNTFFKDESQRIKLRRLIKKVMKKERVNQLRTRII